MVYRWHLEDVGRHRLYKIAADAPLTSGYIPLRSKWALQAECIQLWAAAHCKPDVNGNYPVITGGGVTLWGMSGLNQTTTDLETYDMEIAGSTVNYFTINDDGDYQVQLTQDGNRGGFLAAHYYDNLSAYPAPYPMLALQFQGFTGQDPPPVTDEGQGGDCQWVSAKVLYKVEH
jgi:hypothetical protein